MTQPRSILIVDDDAKLRALLCEYLTSQGFLTHAVPSAKMANAVLSTIRFDAIILDQRMPEMTGLQWLRSHKVDAPVLFLTADGDPQQRIIGLEAGAQDFLAKPFEPKELVLRLRNILQRQPIAPRVRKVRFGEYEFDLAQAHLSKGNTPVELTTAELHILTQLATHAQKPVRRELLWRDAASESGRGVDVHINRLRKKIEQKGKPRYLHTMRGQGYMLMAQPVIESE